MTNFNYFELIAFFYSGIFGQIKQGIEMDQAILMRFDALWLYPEENNYLNNLVVYIHYMNVIYALRRIFTQRQIEVYKEQLALVRQHVILSDWLNGDEFEHFTETIDELNYEIENWERENTIAKKRI